MALTLEEIAELQESSEKLLGFWMRIKLVFMKAFSEGEIAPDQESAYLQLKSEISRLNRGLSDKLTTGLKFEGEKMMEMLKNAMTMEHLRSQPISEKQNIYATWHRLFIKLTRTLGALEVMQMGYHPAVHRERLKSMAVTKKK